MLTFARVPLAWLNLTHDKRRLFFRVLGTAVAVVLLFVEKGFEDALLDAQVQLIRQLNGDLIVVSKANYALSISEPFSRRCLAQAHAVREVRAAFPVYLEHAVALWKDVSEAEGRMQSTQPSQPIRVIAFDPDQPVLIDTELKPKLDALKVPFNILLDRKTKEKFFGRIESGIDRELSGHTVHVSALFTLGTDFTNDGNVIMSAETFARMFGEGSQSDSLLERADLGVVQIDPGADPQAVRLALQALLPEDVEGVRVFTKDDFIEREKSYWKNTTPIGFIFRLGVAVGFIVGFVICSQIISTDVAEHMPQFATLKAIGYSNAFVSYVVMGEALWLAVLGFLPGWGISALLYQWLGQMTGLPMQFKPWSFFFVVFSTVLMCVASGLIAMRKVWTADPAEVFA